MWLFESHSMWFLEKKADKNQEKKACLKVEMKIQSSTAICNQLVWIHLLVLPLWIHVRPLLAPLFLSICSIKKH